MTDNLPTYRFKHGGLEDYREELFAKARLLRDEANILVTRAETWEAAALKIDASLKVVKEEDKA